MQDISNQTYEILTEEIQKELITNIDSNKRPKLYNLLNKLHFSDIALFYSELNLERKDSLIRLTKNKIDPLFLTKLNDSILEETFNILGIKDAAKLLSKLESDEVLDVISDLDKNIQDELLDEISRKVKREVELGLNYSDDTAGRFMHHSFLTISEHWNIKQVKEYIAKNKELVNQNSFALFIINHLGKPQGIILLNEILTLDDEDKVSEVMHKHFYSVKANTSEDELVNLFKKYSLKALAVTDNYDRIIGVINITDIVEIIDETAEEDILHLGGIAESDIFSSFFKTFQQRMPWLVLNLITAIIASIVIGVFDDTIERLVALAVLMPIIASMGGNAGTQAVTIAVRALATKELNKNNSGKIILKETIVGFMNGVIFGFVSMVFILLIFHDPRLAILFAAATIVTLTVAGFSGAIIPIMLNSFKSDPAISSGVILTTVTDVIAFLTFLGFAELFIF